MKKKKFNPKKQKMKFFVANFQRLKFYLLYPLCSNNFMLNRFLVFMWLKKSFNNAK